MKEMGGEKGILPERSEWFRSRLYMSILYGLFVLEGGRAALTQRCRCVRHIASSRAPAPHPAVVPSLSSLFLYTP
jgi:hypothetical protein